jgi:hypothetical protein
MTPELVLSISGVALSLIFEYFPWLARKYNALADDYQKLIMLGLLAAVNLGAYGLSCLGWLTVFKCGDYQALVMSFISSLVANQGTHRLLPKGKS